MLASLDGSLHKVSAESLQKILATPEIIALTRKYNPEKLSEKESYVDNIKQQVSCMERFGEESILSLNDMIARITMKKTTSEATNTVTENQNLQKYRNLREFVYNEVTAVPDICQHIFEGDNPIISKFLTHLDEKILYYRGCLMLPWI